MKKICFLVILILIIITLIDIKPSHAIFFKQGEYLEKNQWGALEDILNDWNNKLITTDECALYGCYVLAAQEPARKDKNNKIKLLPAKYKLEKKSKSAGPYFFVNFLYNFEDKLAPEALNEFRNSDWSDFEFYDKFTKNDKIIEIIKKIKFETGDNDKQFKDIFEVLKKALKENAIDTEEAIIITYSSIHRHERYFPNHKEFIKNNTLHIGHVTAMTIFYFLGNMRNELFNKPNISIKVKNILNYYYHETWEKK